MSLKQDASRTISKNTTAQPVSTNSASTKTTYSHIYVVKNENSLPRKFLLKVPLAQSDVTPAPKRKQESMGIYTIDCAPKSVVKLEVIQKRYDVDIFRFPAINETTLKNWNRDNAKIDTKIQTRLEKIFVAREKLNTLSAERSVLNTRVAGIEREQKRLTDLIKVLDNDSPVLKGYLDKLENSESELAEVREKTTLLSQKIKDASDALKHLE